MVPVRLAPKFGTLELARARSYSTLFSGVRKASNASFTASNRSLSRRLSCLTSGASAIFRYYDSPLITSTGIETPVINSRLSSTNSSVAAIYGPGQFSVSSNGTYRSTLISTTQDEAENCSITIIDPGYAVLITCQMSVGTGITCASELIWNEI